ncbi:MAG: NUDIX hydrolase [Cyclobacteriaceae bacterium]|nr:NUDIX hydrolase [Cyclobacteriaceae bacterium]
MTITSRKKLMASLREYKTAYAEEARYRDQFLKLLNDGSCFHRHHLPGHLTGSAWIVNNPGTKTLLIHHGKLNKWLQPGGHADGDENIFSVALREALEETGLKNLHPVIDAPFDIDIHLIPARVDFPEHLHFDVRFIFSASEFDEVQLSPESNQLQWFNIEFVPELVKHNTSILRMIEKTKVLFGSHQC